MATLKENIARFWDRVDQTGDCWLWTKYCNSDGYGRVRFNGRLECAHAIAWYFSNGTIPVGLCVLHKCDNPPCCKPSHLFLGTHLDNMRDRDVKGRNSRGEQHGRAKLTEADVLEIKTLLFKGILQQAIADQFGISPQLISKIKLGKRWTHVKDAVNAS